MFPITSKKGTLAISVLNRSGRALAAVPEDQPPRARAEARQPPGPRPAQAFAAGARQEALRTGGEVREGGPLAPLA
eukprot:CAMPEP_0194735932 /NCGR_PEP_ID=MMETSP0296-20130528/75521_1 /TAXON_ID=39354 /ORGANISM="Heterosigma akashiwo, Strain CCMP2393" /LENGTH=75 /DNA_ID=CAMNT_0039645319 /DNA_START=77 /DNA_END=300 /DNA_ORIENTATION=-